MSRAAVFVALTGALAALLAVLAALLAARRGLEINIWLTLSTALVVGLFVAFLWLGPREKAAPAPDGFDVVARRRMGAVAKTEPDEREEKAADGPAPSPQAEPPAERPSDPRR